MTELEKNTPPSVRGEKDRRYRRWLYLLFLLFILALLSCGIAGYLLGKNAGPASGGQLIDTILLTPEAGEDTSTILHLTGHVVYSDGTPAGNRRIELHSDPIRTVTDASGNFMFDNVPMGEHNISILNEDGSVAARREILLDRSQRAGGISIDMKKEGNYTIELAVDVRMLEISIELDNDGLYINPDHVTYETAAGLVVTPTGSASVHQGPIVTPSGNICLPDGTIVLPGNGGQSPVAVILPDDTVLYPETTLSAGEIEIAPDGLVTMPDGTIVRPGGEVLLPDGQIQTPGKGGVIVTEEAVIPIGKTAESETDGAGPSGSADTVESADSSTAARPAGPEQTEASGDAEADSRGASSDVPVPTGGETATAASGAESSSQTGSSTVSGGSGNDGGNHGGSSGSGGNSGNGGGNGGGHEPTKPVEPSEPTSPTETAEPTSPTETPEPTRPTDSSESSKPTESETESSSPDNGTLDVEGQVKNTSQYVSWTQTSDIDLFYNRDNPDSPILPGSKGYYQFRLKNSRQEPLAIKLTIRESGNHLPLYFTLTPVKKGILKRTQSTVGTLGGYRTSLNLEAVIEAESETDFRLDWEWPLEGSDKEDTEAGIKGGDYRLTLTVYAEGADS